MISNPATPSDDPEYAWELATLYPEQGEWSEEDYLELTDHAKRRIEFTEGRLEFLPMPTEAHETLTRSCSSLYTSLSTNGNWVKSIRMASAFGSDRVNFACRMLFSCIETTSTPVTTERGTGLISSWRS